MSNTVTLALPGKGAIAEPTYRFLKDCGLHIHKPNPRQYVGAMPAIPEVEVLFQRVKDVVYKVADGTAQIGITGYDVVCEHNHDNLMVIHPELGYGQCQLVVAVPEAWVDVESMYDLSEVALDLREQQGRNLRIATTYTGMTREFFHQQQIHHFKMVKADGAIEVAPTLGYADIIVDLTQTGTTLRENHLKQIQSGTIVKSQACLIANRSILQTQPHVLDVLRIILEHMDATLEGKQYYQISANIQGDNPKTIAKRLMENPTTRGLLGPTIAPVYTGNLMEDWHTVRLTVRKKKLLEVVSYLRDSGASQVIVSPTHYVFQQESTTYRQLLKNLNLEA